MAISGSGSVSFSQIRSEHVGGSASVSASQLYRGGSNIPSKAGDNQATHLAASVPTSGAISADDFRGTAKGFRYTYTANATDQDISALFGDDYDVNYPKEVVINSGVELGATTTANEALEADTGNGGLAGTLTITNNGTITGRGGGAGQAGGDAFEANVTCTFVNNGTIRAGGGGGGNGGTGGQGRTSYSYNTYSSYRYNTSHPAQFWHVQSSTNCHVNFSYLYIAWQGQNRHGMQGNIYNACGRTSYSSYQRGSLVDHQTMQGQIQTIKYQIREVYTNTGYNYHSGGSGGTGGTGAGYQQSATSGSGGSGGGSNAGSGGTGGSGGTFGANGSTGASGANGNYTGGSAGTGGASAGKYLRGSSNVTFTNNGTVQGGTA